MSPDYNELNNEDRVLHLQGRILGLEEQIAELSQRLENTVSSMVKLTQLVRELSNQQRQPAAASPSASPSAPRAASAEDKAAPATPKMLEVIKLVQQGKGEEAQALLQAMPQAELAAQPAIVTLAAATLCLQRGDMQACLKALKRARGFTSDPRLLKVLERVEAKAQAQAQTAAVGDS